MTTLPTATEPLSDFTSDPGRLVEKLRDSGGTIFLTVNEEEEIVVLDIASYDKMRRQQERAETIAAVKESMEDIAAGRVYPAEEVMDELARKYKLRQYRSI